MAITEYDLAVYDDAWEQSSEPEGGSYDNKPVPDGHYIGKVERAEIKATKDGKPNISIAISITDGAGSIGRWVFKNMYPSSDVVSMGYIKKDLLTLGISPSSLSELGDVIDDCVGKEVNITVKNKGEYTNVYLNRDPATDGPIADDDVPF